MGLAETEIDGVDWRSFRVSSGTAERVGPALHELLAAKTPDETERAYWKLENHVVVQGTVYSAAEPTVALLLKALAEDCPSHVRGAILGLLYEVVAGSPAQPEDVEVIHRCRAKCRDAVWVLVRELAVGHRDAALDILALLAGVAKGYDGSPDVRSGSGA